MFMLPDPKHLYSEASPTDFNIADLTAPHFNQKADLTHTVFNLEFLRYSLKSQKSVFQFNSFVISPPPWKAYPQP